MSKIMKPCWTRWTPHGGGTTLALRRTLAQRAFARTAAYDAAVSNWFAGELAKDGDNEPPRRRAFGGLLRQPLRYGENPHQTGGLLCRRLTARPGVASAEQIQGKELSYNNINDTDAAYELVAEFDASAPRLRHHQTCQSLRRGDGQELEEAYLAALACDTVSAFGGVLAFNRTLDGETAEEIAKIFTEVIIAPDADADAKAILAGKKNLRLLLAGALPDPMRRGLTYRTRGGRLSGPDPRQWPCRARRSEDRHQASAERTGNRRHAVRLHRGQTCEIQCDRLCQGRFDRRHRRRPDEPGRFGAHRRDQSPGCGQDRGLAAAADIGSAAASEAFFPFPDGLLAVAEAGATAVIQPGGSVNDQK